MVSMTVLIIMSNVSVLSNDQSFELGIHLIKCRHSTVNLGSLEVLEPRSLIILKPVETLEPFAPRLVVALCL